MQTSSLNLRCQAKFLAALSTILLIQSELTSSPPPGLKLIDSLRDLSNGAHVATHITVAKFGGTSIQDSAAFARVAQIVKAKQRGPLVVVVSAMSGVTDALIAS